MKDKMEDNELIEQMAKDLKTCLPNNWYWQKTVDTDTYFVAKHFHNEGYRKIPKDSVVLSREEFERLQVKLKSLQDTDMFKEAYISQLKEECKQARKETAEKIYYKAEKKAHFKDGGYYDKDRYYLDMEDLKEILKQFGVEIKE